LNNDPGSVTYKWYQTYGRSVTLASDASDAAEFIAPSVGSTQRLDFRVDVKNQAGAKTSATISVMLLADPAYVGPGGGSSTTDPNPQVTLLTSMGEIVLELDAVRAPATVDNFLRYADTGFYNGTIFHRVIEEFVVQGGGYDADLEARETRSPIKNESNNGLKNDRGTVAMARTFAPDSATSQFFINVVDNDTLNYQDPANPGYCVFGKVIQGMDVADAISKVPTSTQNGMEDVPVDPVLIVRAERTGGDDTGEGGGRGSDVP
jgi:cyclophilin family peptidyl-prolyl cis-trans isomerase